jgi:hypothetical protein
VVARLVSDTAASLTGTTIWVTTTFPGWHAWPGAPASRAYLATSHRHLFHVRVEAEVGHDDRELEFHDLLDRVNRALPPERLGPQSCEMIARNIAAAVGDTWPGRVIRATVSEDGECGATVTIRGKRETLAP